MRLAELPQEVVKQIRSCRYDQILEKHEGPEFWAFVLDYADLLTLNGYAVLLPVEMEQHPNITVLRCVVSDDGQTLTLFLKDTTHVDDPRAEVWQAGRIAVCDRFPGQDFYLASLYHEWFIIEPPP